MNIDISKKWIEFIDLLNDQEGHSIKGCTRAILGFFSQMISADHAYMIGVQEGQLDWANYYFTGQQQLFIEQPMGQLHRDLLDQKQVQHLDGLLLIPIIAKGDLILILGFTGVESLDPCPCKDLAAMAEIGYQRILHQRVIDQLEKSERVFRLTFEQAGSGMCQTDLGGHVEFANMKFYDMIGYQPGEAIDILKITYPDDIDLDREHKDRLLAREIQYYSMEKRYVKKDGAISWVYVTVSLVEGEDLEEDYLLGVVQDINQQKAAEAMQKNQEEALEKLVKERSQALIEMNKALIKAHSTKDQVIRELKDTKAALEEMAIKDPLTQLYNRRYMMDQLASEWERYSRYETPFSVIIIDIDHFKMVNDTYGHDCGDYVLDQLSREMEEALRRIDVLCRWGGEEFLVLLPETTLEEGYLVSQRIHQATRSTTYHYKGQDLSITLTLGLASNVDHETIESLIKAADDALYRGKASGRDQIVKA